ncbi:DUF3093 domain-containing protein [Mumia sp. zg.B21]|uniref:DUF3093 domain-containing protein n=1 Tax=unclassified Mumia TaxID=2621872 RepID=UPI001C6E1F0A|nr:MULTISPECIES: DUF3093 domain-containing protein [unclassified Mumia]MBW9208719.1 DUF3093 domain-containing protein [Mumia sp. zg.B21]MDD9349177.1 DUF3093 domain-containing protein [Mumia sp.]
MTREADAPSYREYLSVPVSWWLAGAGLTVIVWWIFVLATPMWVALGAGAVAGAAVAAGLVQYGRAVVEVSNVHLRAGAARLPLVYCGEVTALDAAQTRALHGPQADARAFFLLRPYIATAVQVQVTDSRDPTPYWLIGTRHPHELADALSARRARG